MGAEHLALSTADLTVTNRAQFLMPGQTANNLTKLGNPEVTIPPELKAFKAQYSIGDAGNHILDYEQTLAQRDADNRITGYYEKTFHRPIRTYNLIDDTGETLDSRQFGGTGRDHMRHVNTDWQPDGQDIYALKGDFENTIATQVFDQVSDQLHPDVIQFVTDDNGALQAGKFYSLLRAVNDSSNDAHALEGLTEKTQLLSQLTITGAELMPLVESGDFVNSFASHLAERDETFVGAFEAFADHSLQQEPPGGNLVQFRRW